MLGSAPLLLQRGLTESLAGRFEQIRVPHWSLAEMGEAFGWTLEQFLYFGGYPGAAPLVADRDRWARYILDSLIETTIARDILLLAGQRIRQRGSSPKLLVLNTALMTAPAPLDLEAARRDREFWGRLVESAVGAHLVNTAAGTKVEVFYWRERNHEVDFVLLAGRRVVAVEVKSGRKRDALPGLEAFARSFRPHRILVVGVEGLPVQDFLTRPAADWVKV